ncbi:MAG: hypothetical protein ACYC6Y_02080 [Thermoguttaceae bacterium]
MRFLAATILFFLAASALAAEKPALPAAYLQEQSPFAGRWRGTGTSGDDQVTTEFNARWVPGKHCLILHGTTRKGKQPPVQWSILSGCDASTGEMIDCCFGTDGFSSVTRWKSVTESEQTGTETGLDHGKPFSVPCKAVKHGPDAWTFSSTNLEGKPVVIEYKRVKEPGPSITITSRPSSPAERRTASRYPTTR